MQEVDALQLIQNNLATVEWLRSVTQVSQSIRYRLMDR